MISKQKLTKAYKKAMKNKRASVIRKILLTSIYRKHELLADYVDKIKIRETWIGKEFNFPKIIMVINNPEDVEKLDPEKKYVLKCSAGSGGYKIAFGKDLTKNVVKKFMRMNRFQKNYWKFGEVQYCLGINIFYVEEYLEKLNEIKIHTFDNYVIPTVIPNREINSERYAWDGEDMKRRCEYLHGDYKIQKYENIVDKKLIDEAIAFSKKVQKYFGMYVRVDFLVSNNQLFFGEVTFSHNAGRISFNGNNAMVEKFIAKLESTNGIKRSEF